MATPWEGLAGRGFWGSEGIVSAVVVSRPRPAFLISDEEGRRMADLLLRSGFDGSHGLRVCQ